MRITRLEDQVQSLDPESPGLLLRQDRTDRQIGMMLALVKWMVAGGGIAAAFQLFRAIASWEGKP